MVKQYFQSNDPIELYNDYNELMGLTNECCIESNVRYNLKDKKSIEHLIKHIPNLKNNIEKTNECAKKYLSNSAANKVDLMIYFSAIKYPESLTAFFSNTQALKEAYGEIPWDASEINQFKADFETENNAIFNYLTNFPIGLRKNCFWIKDEGLIFKIAKEINGILSHGHYPEIFEDVWDAAKEKIPKAFEFNEKYSHFLANIP